MAAAPSRTKLPYTGQIHDKDHRTADDKCANRIDGSSNQIRTQWYHDSVVSTDFFTPHISYDTPIKQVFGSADTSAAVPLGLEWYKLITSSKQTACVTDAQHELPGSPQGAEQIAGDLIASCHQ